MHGTSYPVTHRHIPEGCNLQSQCRGKLKTQIIAAVPTVDH